MASKKVLNFTGERIVPGADNCEPNFASRMFQEHIVRYLFAAQIIEGKSVIDIGCGVGYGSQRLGELGAASVRAFDLSDAAIRHARQHYSHPNVQFDVGNAETFEFDAQFDVATCFELIEHVNHPEKVLENIKRALKPDGILVISTPRALEKKRTHFHTHEFGLDEFEALLKRNFSTTEFYVENNHFSSLVTQGRPSILDRIICLKDQFDAEDADVFIVVATPSPTMPLPVMEPALSIDNDAYVRMLERDVEILHKAENDLKEKITYLEKSNSEALAFKDREIERITGEYGVLFSQSNDLSDRLWKSEENSAQADFLRGEAEELKAALKKTEAQHIEAIAFKDGEIQRITGEYNILFSRAEELSSELWHANQLNAEMEALRTKAHYLQQSLNDFEQHHAQVTLFKNTEIERLTADCNDLLGKAESISAEFAEEKRRSLEALAAKDAEIEQLAGERERLSAEVVDAATRIEELQARYAGHEAERDNLRRIIEALSVRANEAEAKRLEVYEYARASNDAARGARLELEALKRDIAEAIENPRKTGEVRYDPRHRDIVESMERLFLGTAATHDIARSPLVERVSLLAVELEEQRERANRSRLQRIAEIFSPKARRS